LGYNIDE